MITVNLKDLYYWCKEDIFVEITEEMLEAMKAADRQESAYKRRTYRYKAHYTLDMEDGIANECVIKPETPEEAYIKKEAEEMLTAALNTLTEAQQRRLKLYYFEGMRYSQIARLEGVTDGSISGSIKSALKHLGKQKEVKQFKEYPLAFVLPLSLIANQRCTTKKRSVATSHAPLFLGLLEMGLREQDRLRQAGTRP
ncbi:RNA polymerase sigma factor (sigma-70 family) [Fontibacillus phaseoli]|uniref:RNA polymerase sigma factor (Sigma-70 family) n=1 Tax=Fontibacillus phaseoli TaxID=1416533 RepID=A0A369BL46_9BACL|nr:sigma-70 family RNA polymerase sigma factor [Fontibacillus phaseoli]RCX21338.1 RNA polymerase sigma factor (sigma-70 family) [Fontibacillus phaseoli]